MKKIIIILLLILVTAYPIKKLIYKVKNYYSTAILQREIASILDNRTDLNKFYVNNGHTNPACYIAHGGGIGEFTYTNSLEAILNSLERGFQFIEIDMLETSDNHIIGGHDWKHFKSITGLRDTADKPLPLSTAKNQKIKQKYTVISGEEIATIMKEHPDLILITDKIRNYKLLLQEIPYQNRMIVEVFSPQDYLKALRAGIKYPAYCVWGIKQLGIAKQFNFPIITMDAKNFFENSDSIRLAQELHNKNVTILLFYTSFSQRDTTGFIKKHAGRSFSKVYTDTWSPSTLP